MIPIVIEKTKINEEKRVNEITKEERRNLVKALKKLIKQFLNKNKKWKGRIILINDSRAITEYNAIEFY